MRIAILVFLSLLSPLSPAKTVTDMLGRQVEIPDNPQRIILGESRMLYTLALLEPGNPAKNVVGWPGDMPRYDAQSWQRYTQKFPQIAQIPQLGNGSLQTMNAESLLPLKPDLVILPRLAKTAANEDRLLQTLTNAGVPVIYVDLRVDLLNHTLPSIRLLGEALNQPERAAAFSAFYQRHMDRVRQRIEQYHGKKTTVMLHLHLGRRDTCCTTAVGGNLGDLLRFAGGENIAAGVISSVYGELSPERALAAKPDVYIATGMAGPQGKRFSSLMLGPQVAEQQADSSFRDLIRQEPILSHLDAVRNGRAWSMWHNFYLSPYHVVMVEMFAKALYPDLFTDIDPQHTLQALYQQFLPIDFSGTYWSHLTHE
ncbi:MULTISPECIES: ABC transporter substrate-binding protein [unclassified Brenneria]|uniref:ABC transporter substrate-binding protein n=1 Tax=unclassified Brenneria TaxID=2634434 RepID=UPI001556F005|nr:MULTISPECIES: ABC transporter substrate-binding protein [unclassified Brenneria]MBJ7221736.1 ABC transporter substrate-binding protein [Brenneria sp. L3-3C-1]MEE3642977.1 ABC transporter substrate-binding protein [Brenneria sp. L3_3C_1]MEE3650837.1 ABC transporter substrate-binding protein [Brenneria sp. HEZEL_4_2_4]NPD00792.1 ABC transporter substrate-binding protein [Brenneria sp. hezel4-2-4]